jgi:hypothetical protein
VAQTLTDLELPERERDIRNTKKRSHLEPFAVDAKMHRQKKPKDLEKTLRKAHACMMMLSTRKHSNPKTGNRKTCNTFGFF